jgi:hypothetical protein
MQVSVTDLRSWLLDEVDETRGRLSKQVLDLVAPERRGERPGGGSSITWNLFHIARHAGLALSVLTGDLTETLAQLDGLPFSASAGGGGLEEAEPPWSEELDPLLVETHLNAVLDEVRSYLAEVPLERFVQYPEVRGGFEVARIAPDRFGWLWQMWEGRPASFLVRWPLIGHVGNHVGEMLATRNRLGLSPF